MISEISEFKQNSVFSAKDNLSTQFGIELRRCKWNTRVV